MGSTQSKAASKERSFLMDVHKLTPEQFDIVYRQFKGLAGKKRYINFQDFCTLYDVSRFEHDPSDLRVVFRALAADTDRISLAGFVRLRLLCGRAGNESDSERLRVLFKVMDSDSSGTISEAEFCRFLNNFVDDEATMQNFFATLDRDDSKMIDYQEFANFCEKHKRAYQLMCAYVFPIAR